MFEILNIIDCSWINTVADPEGKVTRGQRILSLSSGGSRISRTRVGGAIHALQPVILAIFSLTLHEIEKKNGPRWRGVFRTPLIILLFPVLCIFYFILGLIKTMKSRCIELSLLAVTAEGTGATEGYWWSPGLTHLIYAEFNSSAPHVSEHPVYGQTDQFYPYNFKQVYIKAS